ncbi:hypothetical protein BDZ94DRAFT_843559 [Collybia nuda]|uniref:HTH APSES-type domain-containing protein n=1 Tax=Collybia nuda TaxID=64659 RepID=A0A9P5YGF8_9AGAR|nr:hypothetical protein BDZ94DRAFT_843559 [Collybia nuda]
MSTRPPLPVRHANPHIPLTLTSGTLPPVKYQILNCQGQDILVGRMKIETPTPSGHAFILRRFDTGAVSLTTMFRAAFPNAPEHEEKSELQWVKENHDLSGNNGGPHNPQVTRLAGTWVSPSLAQTIGDAYALGDLIKAVVEATPDPKASYRRSGKAAAVGNTTVSPAPVVAKNVTPAKATVKPPSKTLPTPSPTAAPNPAKRRKESSPVPAPVPVASTPSLRRSMRTKSPAATSAAVAPLAPIPKTSRIAKLAPREEALTPQGSDQTVVEEDTEIIEDGITGSELRQQDIQEQQELIKNLKKQRNVAPPVTTTMEGEETDGGVDVPTKLKRAREDEEQPLKFDFKEPEVGERAIATNNRVARFQLEPRTRSFVWGIAAFAVGMSAVSLLPSLF